MDEDGHSDRKFRQLLYDFSVFASSLEYVRAHLASQLGISSPQYNIVMIVAQYQEDTGVTVSDVGRHLHVSTAFVTGEAGKLERLGFLRKVQNPSDGRSILLCLTSFAEENVRKVGPERLLLNDQLFAGVSGRQFRHLAETMSSLLKNFDETANTLKFAR